MLLVLLNIVGEGGSGKTWMHEVNENELCATATE